MTLEEKLEEKLQRLEEAVDAAYLDNRIRPVRFFYGQVYESHVNCCGLGAAYAKTCIAELIREGQTLRSDFVYRWLTSQFDLSTEVLQGFEAGFDAGREPPVYDSDYCKGWRSGYRCRLKHLAEGASK